MDKTLLTVTAIGLAHAAYEQLTDFMTKAMGTWMDALPSNPMTAGFKDIQDRVAAMAKQNAGSVFAFAGKISNAQTLQDVLMLHAIRSRPDAGLRHANTGASKADRGSAPEAATRLISPLAARVDRAHHRS